MFGQRLRIQPVVQNARQVKRYVRALPPEAWLVDSLWQQASVRGSQWSVLRPVAGLPGSFLADT